MVLYFIFKSGVFECNYLILDNLSKKQNLELKDKVFFSHRGAQKTFVDQLCMDINIQLCMKDVINIPILKTF
jgi:hypothetical protein